MVLVFGCANEKRPFKAVCWNRVISIVVGHDRFEFFICYKIMNDGRMMLYVHV